MSDELKVGDRVTWKPKYRHRKTTPEIMTGRVIAIHGGRKPWAGVRVTEPREGNWCVDLDRLTRVNPTALVAAVATTAQDDQEREDVIAALKWAGSVR